MSEDKKASLNYVQEVFKGRIDADVVAIILTECQYNIEKAVNQLLTITDGSNSTNNGCLSSSGNNLDGIELIDNYSTHTSRALSGGNAQLDNFNENTDIDLHLSSIPQSTNAFAGTCNYDYLEAKPLIVADGPSLSAPTLFADQLPRQKNESVSLPSVDIRNSEPLKLQTDAKSDSVREIDVYISDDDDDDKATRQFNSFSTNKESKEIKPQQFCNSHPKSSNENLKRKNRDSGAMFSHGMHNSVSGYPCKPGLVSPQTLPFYGNQQCFPAWYHSGFPPSGMVPSGMTPPGMVPPGMVPPGMVPSGMVPQGMVSPGMVPPGMVPAGMTPGVVPPGMVSPGMVPPGMVPSGMIPPGMVPPGMVPPGMVPPGMVPPGIAPHRGFLPVGHRGTVVSGTAPQQVIRPQFTNHYHGHMSWKKQPYVNNRPTHHKYRANGYLQAKTQEKFPSHPKKLLIILRGLPGSGKSTLARYLKTKSGVVISTDDYFMKGGRYHFKPSELSAAHEWNQNKAKRFMEGRLTPVIIDNTNTQAWEMKPYVVLGLRYGYKIDIREPETWWKWNIKELERRNSHGVTAESLEKMIEHYEKYVTVSTIMKSVRHTVEAQSNNDTRENKELSAKFKTRYKNINRESDNETLVACVVNNEITRPVAETKTSLSPTLSATDSPRHCVNGSEQYESDYKSPQLITTTVEGGGGKIVTEEEHNGDTECSQLESECARISYVDMRSMSGSQTINDLLRVEHNGDEAKDVQSEERLTVSYRGSSVEVIGTEDLGDMRPNLDEDLEARIMSASDEKTLDLVTLVNTALIVSLSQAIDIESANDEATASSGDLNSHNGISPASEPCPSESNSCSLQDVTETPDDQATCGSPPIQSFPVTCDASLVQSFSVTCGSPPIQSFPVTCDSSPVQSLPVTCGSPPIQSFPITCGASPVQSFPVTCDASPVQSFAVTCASPPIQSFPVTCDASPVQSFPVTCGSPPIQSFPVTCGASPGQSFPVTCDASPVQSFLVTCGASPVQSFPVTCDASPVQSFPATCGSPPIQSFPVTCGTPLVLPFPESKVFLPEELNSESVKDGEVEDIAKTRESTVVSVKAKLLAPAQSFSNENNKKEVPKSIKVLDNDLPNEDGSIEITIAQDKDLRHTTKEEKTSPVTTPESIIKECSVDTTGIGISSEDSNAPDSLQFLQDCFPDVDATFLKSFFNCCHGDLLKTVDRVLEYNEIKDETDVYDSDDECEKETTSTTIETTLPADSFRTPTSNERILSNSGEAPERNDLTDFTGAALGNSNKGSCTKSYSTPASSTASTSSDFQDISFNTLNLTLDPALALQLLELFGSFSGVSARDTLSESVLSVKIDQDFAKLLYSKWRKTVQEKNKSKASEEVKKNKVASNRGAFDGNLKRKFKTTPREFFLPADVNYTPPKHVTLHEPVSLKEIMDEQLAVHVSQSEEELEKNWKEENLDLSSKLKRSRLHGMFPGIDAVSLNEIFQANNYNLDKTILQVQSSCGITEDSSPVLPPRSSDFQSHNKHEVKLTNGPFSGVDGGATEFQSLDEPTYEDFRAEANTHFKLRDQSIKKAALAYSRKQGELARFYADQARVHFDKIKEANRRAAEKIMETRNSDLRTSNTLDLHELHVGEAIQILEAVLEERKQEMKSPDRKSPSSVQVITGRGSRSRDGKPRIKPAVVNYLNNNGYRYEELNMGLYRVFLN